VRSCQSQNAAKAALMPALYDSESEQS